ncbi:MAG TPA: hypothetical protein PKO15_18740, partial [Fibrobacteria bacterium]|nr:hypothetical protein [Fibrobacteria bacterium]
MVEENVPPASGEHYVRFNVPDSSTIPDRLWYRGPQDSGSKPFSLQSSDLSIRFFAPLHAMEARDTLQIHTCRLGLHLSTIQAGLFQYMEFAGVRTVRTPTDSLAIFLLRRYDSLRTWPTAPSRRPSPRPPRWT